MDSSIKLDIKADIGPIKSEFDRLEAKLDQTQEKHEDEVTALNEAIKLLKKEIAEEKQKPSSLVDNKFTFRLEKDDKHFNADKSLAKIIEEGQKYQVEYWHSGEERLGKRWSSPSGEGWLGSVVSPLVRVNFDEPEYHFRGTQRIPSRFCMSGGYGWSSVAYCELDSDECLIDDNRWGTQTNARVGFYVEPASFVDDAVLRAHEQRISDLIIVTLNGGMPVYLGMNQDRFSMENVNIQQHQGALVGIKHGPILDADWYPVKQRPIGNVSLPDPRFINMQMEGPFSNKPQQAAMMLSGLNGSITNLNLHGWAGGPVIFSDNNWLINGITVDEGLTADGRLFTDPNKILPYCISQVDPNAKRSAVGPVAGGFEGWYLPKRSKAPATKGFYQKGQTII